MDMGSNPAQREVTAHVLLEWSRRIDPWRVVEE